MSLLLLATLGGTIVQIPFEGKDAPRIEMEILTCCAKEFRGRWRYGTCVHCDQAMKSERGTVERDVRLRNGVLEIVGGGDLEKLAVVRMSEIPGAKRGRTLVGPFALHGKDLSVERIAKLEGVMSVEKVGDVVYVNQSHLDARVPAAFLAEFAVDDVSWVVNLCQGRVGFEK